MKRKEFDWKPENEKEIMEEISKIENKEARDSISVYVKHCLANEIADEYNENTDEKYTKEIFTEMCERYTLAKSQISMVAYLVDGDIIQYVFLLLNNIVAEVEEYAREMAYDDAYEDLEEELDEKLKNENKNLREIIENQMEKTKKIEEKAKESEKFIDFIKEEIPDVYKKLRNEFMKRKEIYE